MPKNVTKAEVITRTPQSSGFAITSLVLGILAFINGWLPIIGLLLGIGAVVFGILAARNTQIKGFWIAGIITGALGLLTSLVISIFFVIAFSQPEFREGFERGASGNSTRSYEAGETAEFGDFEVTIGNVERGITSTLPPRDEQDEYVGVEFTITNVGDEDATLSPSAFRLLVGSGERIPTSRATVEPRIRGGSIQPDQSVTGVLVYEVPTDIPTSDLSIKYTDTILNRSGNRTQTIQSTLDLE